MGIDVGLAGNFPLDDDSIDKNVTQISAGVYALGLKLDGDDNNAMPVRYVGRSDDNVNARLKTYLEAGKYRYFAFAYSLDANSAYEKQCELYHQFGGPDRNLDNEFHPPKPFASSSCPKKCGH
ncbi:MAG TPA: hypothetical protein VIX12_01055 [Candidatus Binataceae bacterium]